MNQNWDDRYRRLFKELKQKDEERAPAFERVWQAALSKTKQTNQSWKFSRLAIAAALLLALVGSLLFYTKKSLVPVQSMSDWQAPTHSLLNFPGDGLQTAQVSIAKPQKALSLSRWESPTAYLLEPPDQDFFKKTPRLKN